MKIFDPGVQKLWPKKVFFFAILSRTKNFVVVFSLNLTKIIEVFEINYFSKVEFNLFFTTTKYTQIKKIIQNLQRQKVVKINFREKVHITDPYYFG